MKKYTAVVLTTLLVTAFGTFADGQDRGQRDGQNRNPQFSEHDQQVTHDWYNQHQSNPPAGFRKQDQLSSEEESRLREGAVLNGSLRRKVHPAPRDLDRQLPPPPPQHRYVAIGDHVALVDHGYNVKAVIHLH